jgi:hypothetical protein
MASLPKRLQIVGNTTLPMAASSVSGQGVITADVVVDGGGTLGPNGFTGAETGTLAIVGSLRGHSGSHLTARIAAASAGQYDSFALCDIARADPAGDAILDNGTGITLVGMGLYHTPVVGDYIDVITAARVIIGSLNLSPVGLPTVGWHYGVVSIPGGQALRIQYGAAVVEPGTVAIHGIVRLNGMPAANVVVAVAPGISGLTAANGHYTLAVPTNSSGTITPDAAGYACIPVFRSFTSLTADLMALDFLMTGTLAPVLVMTAEGTLRRVTWNGVVGIAYQAETSTNLVNWSNYGGALPGTGDPLSFTFPDRDRSASLLSSAGGEVNGAE